MEHIHNISQLIKSSIDMKNQLIKDAVRQGRIHITDTDYLNNLLEVMNIGVTSDEAFYGAYNYSLQVLNGDLVGKRKIQRVSIAGEHYTTIIERTFNGASFSAWLPRIGTSRPEYAPIGYRYFDVNFGKEYTLLSDIKTKAVVEMVITAFGNGDGPVTVNLDGVDITIPLSIPVDYVGSPQDYVNEYISSFKFTGWDSSVDIQELVTVITLTNQAVGIVASPTFTDTDETGMLASIVVTSQGSDNVWVDAFGVGNIGDIAIIGLDGEMSFIEAPSVASTLAHSGVAGTLPYWDALA